VKRGLLPLDIPPSWQQSINALCDVIPLGRPIVQVCGPANSGRSTFSQLLINNWLSIPRSSKRLKAIAMLDLDPTKSENSPPGQISLTIVLKPILKPSFARTGIIQESNQIIRAHAIGLDGYRENTVHYLEAVEDLIVHYHSLANNESLQVKGFSNVPLVAIFPAWYQGSGVDLNVSLTRTIKPSQVICLGQGSLKAMDALQEAAGERKIEVIGPQPFQSSRAARTTSELREMQLLSYFHSEQDSTGLLVWNSKPLSSRRPYQVSYSVDRCEIAGVFAFGEVPVMYPNMLSTLLNGSLVSLIAIEDASELKDADISRGEGDQIPYFAAGPKGYTTPFDPRKSLVIGVALIRAINTTEQTLQILTPVPAQKIAEIDYERLVLAFGAQECPGWAYTEDQYYHGSMRGKGKKKASVNEMVPWVEDAGDDEGRKQLSGPAMQAWKTRRFH
jgi:polynucleotide 5'-hydroxyl-kinase GRC3/NOL9